MKLKKMLELKNISKHFEGVIAVNNVCLNIDRGTIICITGGNGAGKTTLFNIITGFEQCREGKILYKQQDITKHKPSLRAQNGIARLFQTPRVFSHLTLTNNLLASTKKHPGEKIINYLTFKGFRKVKDVERANTEKVMKWLTFCGLQEHKDNLASQLSFGQTKLLGLAMLLMNDAELLLLDEIYSGINQNMISKINKLLVELRKDGKTFIIIEHRVKEIESICDKVVYMEQGNLNYNSIND